MKVPEALKTLGATVGIIAALGGVVYVVDKQGWWGQVGDVFGLDPTEVQFVTAAKSQCKEARALEDSLRTDRFGEDDAVVVKCASSDERWASGLRDECTDKPRDHVTEYVFVDGRQMNLFKCGEVQDVLDAAGQ